MPQGYAPKDAVAHMTVAPGLTVKLFAAEPDVRQPILVKCDARGRLWVIQYLQYPNPAGLKRVKVDRWSRTVFDRVPEPPPKGPKGADRITIYEDTDGDGKADKVKDFVTGLNLATGLAFGHGGVYVLQAPYLLFYPDANRDDVPDRDPDVLLTGFGMEDAQSQANHLTWGPDGWLYGVNGSTTTCNIRGIEFQQGVWRYHPLTKKFELFCEGGGNLFGLTFDEKGNLFYSSNGNYLFFHAIQGAYYLKNFGKHGPLHNPHTYGHFLDVKKRTPVRTGPSTGGTIYKGHTFPRRFRGAFLCGDFLGHTASWWTVKPFASTFEANFGGLLVDSHDTWFGPTDFCLAPDGSVFLCDWFDKRTAHPDPDADWDRSNGRVYKIEAPGTKPVSGLNLSKLTSKQLVALLKHANGWYADQARVFLAARRDASILPELRDLALAETDENLALQYLWALYVSGGFDDEIAGRLLKRPQEYVRAWTVRFLGDERQVSPELAEKLFDLARTDPSPVVRCQLAATAKRLPAKLTIEMVQHLLNRNLDRDDPYIPSLLWWAIEHKALAEPDALIRFFTGPAAWEDNFLRSYTLKFVRRWGADGTQAGYLACVNLLNHNPPPSVQGELWQALSQGLSERTVGLRGVDQSDLFKSAAGVFTGTANAPVRKYQPLNSQLQELIGAAYEAHPRDYVFRRLAHQAEIPSAMESLLQDLSDKKTPTEDRLALLQLAGEFCDRACVPVILPLVGGQEREAVQAAALDVLRRFAEPAISERILAAYSGMTPTLKSRAREILLAQPAGARALLRAVDNKKLPAADVPIEQLRIVALHADKDLDALVRKHWGNIQPGTPEEKLAVMRRLSNDLRAAAGDRSRGKLLFQKHCATCHKLFGEGNTVGPDLTPTSRGDREFLLASLVDPSAVIKNQYLSYVVTTTAGAILTGLIADQDAASITLVNDKNERTKIPRDKIEAVKESPTSLMPEKLVEQLTPQELRDLFAYLQQ